MNRLEDVERLIEHYYLYKDSFYATARLCDSTLEEVGILVRYIEQLEEEMP